LIEVKYGAGRTGAVDPEKIRGSSRGTSAALTSAVRMAGMKPRFCV
jgi:hypothetical protein